MLVKAKALTISEERMVLDLLKDAGFYDNGASRCVFECSDEIARYLGICADDYIIKLACGMGGIRQTEAEVECYLNNPDAPLAKIFAYGRYVEVMERVEIEEDFRDFAEECCEDWGVPYETFYDYNCNGSEDEGYSDDDDRRAEEAYDVIIQLHEIFGHTADNGQLGRDKNGYLVAYDYGFIAGNGCDGQTSEVADYMYNDVQRNAYIDAVIKLLDESIEMLRAWEDAFLSCDNEVYDHDNSYAYYEFRVLGIDKNKQDFRHNYRNENIARQVAAQLAEYVILRRQKHLNRRDWETKEIEKIIIDQKGIHCDKILEYAD